MTEREMGYTLGRVDVLTELLGVCEVLLETVSGEEAVGVWDVQAEIRKLLEKEVR